MKEDFERIALLIDADNTQISKLESAILEISKYGKILVKRAYGNWTKDSFKNWEEIIRKLAIKPIQQIDYVKGKNATDMALVIDAMDFLYNSEYDGFAIVSSDSDFTPLAIKLKESGKTVIGIGKKATSEAFVASCDTFVYLEDLTSTKKSSGEKNSGEKSDKDTQYSELDNLLKIVFETWQTDEGYVNVGAAGAYIGRVKPDFNIKQYDAKNLPDYLRKHKDKYEVRSYKPTSKLTVIEYKII